MKELQVWNYSYHNMRHFLNKQIKSQKQIEQSLKNVFVE